MTQRRPKGHALAFMVLAMLVVSALVVTASRVRLAEVGNARADWLAAAADGLAEAGVQAGLAAARLGRMPLSEPLGSQIALGVRAEGSLTVQARRAGDRHVIRSCATAAELAHHSRTCVQATVTLGRWADIVDWRVVP
jgi:hypothetical protein